MQLNTPFQSAPDKESLLAEPRKVKRWLKELPPTNMGESTRQFYEGLRDSNRLAIPPKKRLEIMELMRPTARQVVRNLHKHLLARSYPLPAKTRKILQLNLSIQDEMANGYKSAVNDAANGKGKLDPRSQTLAVQRAMRYLQAQFLSSMESYVGYNEGNWRDLYALYAFAEQQGLLDRHVKDEEYESLARATVEDTFRQTVLLELSKPQSLRQGEAAKLASWFERATGGCMVRRDPTPDAEGNVYVMDLDSDEPPVCATASQIESSPYLRFLDIGVLIESIQAQIKGTGADPGRGTTRESLSVDLYRRLHQHLTTSVSRRFSRGPGRFETEATVVIGLPNIHLARRSDDKAFEETDIQDEPSIADAVSDVLTPPSSLAIDPNTEELVKPGRFEFRAKTETGMSSGDAWDMVAKGNVIGEKSFVETRDNKDGTLPRRNTDEIFHIWGVINVSAGGYRLRTEDAQASNAHVGEIIAMRFPHGSKTRCHVGVIRWMQAYGSGALDIGVQLMGPRILPIAIQFVDVSRHTSPEPSEGLVLPGVQALNQPSTLLLPPREFAVGDRVIATLDSRENRLELTELVGQTGSFSQFRYISLSEPDESSTSHDEFESLWSRL
ncbi:MAG: hypothetical protein U9R74_19855 [Pseudomonadota bacterium]|nr:hypothetical protein [Pseudomonadota bacterium]